MTDSILLEGKKGHGKSLVQIKHIRSYLMRDRMVATNLNLYMENLMGPLSTATAIRLPDHPDAHALEMIGISTEHDLVKRVGREKADEIIQRYKNSEQPSLEDRDALFLTDESKYGLLDLDEVGSFLNSRNWQGKDRLDVISFLSQCRKFGWDSLLSAQHHKMVDSQIRQALCDIRGVARRLDKIAVPFLAPLFKHFTGRNLKLPKLHIVTFFYGFEKSSPVSWREMFTGSDLWNAYDTTQKISGISGNQHTYCYLSAWHLKGRYMTPYQLHGRIGMAGLLVGLSIGLLVGYLLPHGSNTKAVEQVATVSTDVTVRGYFQADNGYQVTLSNGQTQPASEYKFTPEGKRFRVGNTWYIAK